MGTYKMKTVRQLNRSDLEDRLNDLRSELRKLQVEAAKGTLRKESGKIRSTKREIARIMTRFNELKATEKKGAGNKK